MEACRPLWVFFDAIKNDPRICATHIGLFATIVQMWQSKGFPEQLRAYAHEIMPLAKISASTTYHRCIRDLHDFGYIIYEPSYKRNQRSMIYLKISEDGQVGGHLPRKRGLF